MKPMKGTIAAMAKPSAAPKGASHPHKNLGGYLHPKGESKGKC